MTSMSGGQRKEPARRRALVRGFRFLLAAVERAVEAKKRILKAHHGACVAGLRGDILHAAGLGDLRFDLCCGLHEQNYRWVIAACQGFQGKVSDDRRTGAAN
jgi:hypothetical protein